MLNRLQKQQLEQSHLHKILRSKGVLDDALMREMETWRQILIRSLQTNDYLNQRKEYYKSEKERLGGEVLRLMTEKNGLSARIINHQVEKQDLNRQIEGLNQQIIESNGQIGHLESQFNITINSYREQNNEILQQNQQDRTNFLNALRNKQNQINDLEADLDTNDV